MFVFDAEANGSSFNIFVTREALDAARSRTTMAIHKNGLEAATIKVGATVVYRWGYYHDLLSKIDDGLSPFIEADDAVCEILDGEILGLEIAKVDGHVRLTATDFGEFTISCVVNGKEVKTTPIQWVEVAL